MNPATEPVLKHFNILFIILNLVAGTAVYLTVRQQYQKHRDPLLRRLFPYILSFNLLVAVDLGYQYLMTNLSPETAGLPFAPVGLMLVLVFAAEFGITVSLVRVATEIEGRALPVWAGILPLHLEAKAPVPDPRLAAGISVPEYVLAYRKPQIEK